MAPEKDDQNKLIEYYKKGLDLEKTIHKLNQSTDVRDKQIVKYFQSVNFYKSKYLIPKEYYFIIGEIIAACEAKYGDTSVKFRSSEEYVRACFYWLSRKYFFYIPAGHLRSKKGEWLKRKDLDRCKKFLIAHGFLDEKKVELMNHYYLKARGYINFYKYYFSKHRGKEISEDEEKRITEVSKAKIERLEKEGKSYKIGPLIKTTFKDTLEAKTKKSK